MTFSRTTTSSESLPTLRVSPNAGRLAGADPSHVPRTPSRAKRRFTFIQREAAPIGYTTRPAVITGSRDGPLKPVIALRRRGSKRRSVRVRNPAILGLWLDPDGSIRGTTVPGARNAGRARNKEI